MSNSQRRIGVRNRRSPYDRSSRRRQHDHPFVLELQTTITPHSVGITIINISSRDLVERALRQQHVPDYFNGGSSQNSSYDSQPESELLFDDQEDLFNGGSSQIFSDDSQPESELLFDDQEAYTEEKEDDAI
ncbi:hypothetical protein MTR67_050695 [Solanum verrucosum]|uniref:Uncharacterized protein n=1 Tax=Solanum verrucosum TaxID=315347 RepID=A0AAF0V2G8_SOLVR|nr:hypothetical protein MTR67_050695 [Solanum verrucosum]